MNTLTIRRVLAGPPRGSSRPVLVDTAAGKYLVKLRGAAQGPGALVAEIIVAALAEALDLRVPPRCLAVLEKDTPIDDRNDELADLLGASIGLNLAFPLLEGARDAGSADLAGFTAVERAALLWLDRLVLNPDRTERNPNILWHDGRPHPIDHGSALRFQYNWAKVTEATPREIGTTVAPHLFEEMARSPEWAAWDASFAARLPRAVLEDAVDSVPDDFLAPLLAPFPKTAPSAPRGEAIRRRRAAYVAFLWKRLKPPRTFANESPAFQTRSGNGRPDRLKRPSIAGPPRR